VIFKHSLDAATAYIARGWHVVPLAPKSKAAVVDDWIRLIFTSEDFREDDGIGIRSVNGVVIVDLDCLEAVALADSFLPKTGVVWGRPSKPRAKRLYLSVFPKTVTFKDQDNHTTLLEIRSNHQDVAPPSYHPQGEQLTWDLFGDPATVEVHVLLHACRLLSTAAMIARYYAGAGARHEWCLALAGTLRKRYELTQDECLLVMRGAAKFSGDTKVDDRLTEVRTTYARGDDDPLVGEKALGKAGATRDFIDSLRKIWGGSGGDGQWVFNHDQTRILHDHQQNIKRALDKLSVTLGYNAFSFTPVIKYLTNEWEPLEDPILDRVWLTIQEKFQFLPTPRYYLTVMKDLAHQHTFHPVRDYLKTLTWDNVPRLDTWLIRLAGVEDSPYTRVVGRTMLLAAVRRVLQPGSKFDEMVVFESPMQQGMEKSTALAALCPQYDWFTDDLPLNVSSRQLMERTAGKWIIEASDLAGMKKAGVEKLKSMLSRQKDSDRMVYDKLSTERKRQFIIVGTTNSEKYLQDQTGNRRFWPVRVIKFNVHGIKKERDQLWAEAYTLEQSGASIRMPQELWHLAAIQQEKRRTEDPWEDILEPNFDEQHAYRLTKEQVWMLLGVSSSYRDENAEARIAAIMPRLGFRRGKVSVAGKKYNGWCRGERTGPQALPLGLADGTEDVTEENE
jgi:hypothetical protein